MLEELLSGGSIPDSRKTGQKDLWWRGVITTYDFLALNVISVILFFCRSCGLPRFINVCTSNLQEYQVRLRLRSHFLQQQHFGADLTCPFIFLQSIISCVFDASPFSTYWILSLVSCNLWGSYSLLASMFLQRFKQVAVTFGFGQLSTAPLP